MVQKLGLFGFVLADGEGASISISPCENKGCVVFCVLGRLGLFGFVFVSAKGGFIVATLCVKEGFVDSWSLGNWVCFA
jgi:hypothetical protein